MKYTDEQDKERHALVGITEISERNDIQYFKRLSLDTLKILLEKKYIVLDENQNYSPTIGEFMLFMGSEGGKKIMGLTAHGYIVSNGRDDCRISLEGLEHMDRRSDAIKAFLLFNRHADELDDFRSWWD